MGLAIDVVMDPAQTQPHSKCESYWQLIFNIKLSQLTDGLMKLIVTASLSLISFDKNHVFLLKFLQRINR